MAYKKWFCGLLMMTQLFGGSVLATVAAGTNETSEFQLMQNIFALQGSSASSQQKQQQVLEMLAQYTRTAPPENREQRLQDSLVRMGAFTAGQAQAFFADAQSSELKVANSSTESQSQQVLTSEITRLMQEHLEGAQFSGCKDWTGAAFLGGVGLLVVGVIGNGLFSDNPSCTTNIYAYPVPGAIEDDYGTFDKVVCSKANYYPHRQLGLGMEIGAGAGIVVLALLAFVEGHC